MSWFENSTLITGLILPLVRRLLCFHSSYVNFFLFLILYDKIYRSIPIPDHAKTSGYTPEAAAKMLKHLIAILWKTTGESTEQLKIWILPMPDSLTIKESCSLPCWGCDFTSNTLLSCAKRHARALQKVTIIQWEKCPIFTPFC